MTDSQLQSALNNAFNEVLREWAEDDIETEIPLQVVLAFFNAAQLSRGNYPQKGQG